MSLILFIIFSIISNLQCNYLRMKTKNQINTHLRIYDDANDLVLFLFSTLVSGSLMAISVPDLYRVVTSAKCGQEAKTFASPYDDESIYTWLTQRDVCGVAVLFRYLVFSLLYSTMQLVICWDICNKLCT